MILRTLLASAASLLAMAAAPAAPPPVIGAEAASAIAATTRTVAAGQTSYIDANGSFVVCLYCNLATFGLSIDGGPSSYFIQGLKASAPNGLQFGSLLIDNTGNSNALKVTLMWGFGDADPSALANSDAGLLAALQKQSFCSGQEILMGAGDPSIMLWNPSGSGVMLELRTIFLFTDQSGVFLIGPAASPFGGTLATGINKFIGGAAGKGGTLNNSGGGAGGTGIFAGALGANQPFIYAPARPLVIPAGSGVAASGQGITGHVYVDYDWDEVTG